VSIDRFIVEVDRKIFDHLSYSILKWSTIKWHLSVNAYLIRDELCYPLCQMFSLLQEVKLIFLVFNITLIGANPLLNCFNQ